MSKQNDDIKAEEIDCLEAIDNLYAWLDGELTDKETLAKFEQHLRHCQSCYTRSELEGVINERAKLLKDKTPRSLQQRLRNIIDEL